MLAAEVAPHGRPEDRPGLCWLPGGEDHYATLVRVHTTTDRDPTDLHRTGLDMIGALAAEYAEIGASSAPPTAARSEPACVPTRRCAGATETP